jgi:hypothetical protein
MDESAPSMTKSFPTTPMSVSGPAADDDACNKGRNVGNRSKQNKYILINTVKKGIQERTVVLRRVLWDGLE